MVWSRLNTWHVKSVETFTWLSSLPIFMQELFWWWQCSDSYIISLFSHLHTPFPPLHVPDKSYGFCGRQAPCLLTYFDSNPALGWPHVVATRDYKVSCGLGLKRQRQQGYKINLTVLCLSYLRELCPLHRTWCDLCKWQRALYFYITHFSDLCEWDTELYICK